MIPELERVLTGKRLIIVAKSSYLLEKPECENQGAMIDSYDFVARIKNISPHNAPVQGIKGNFGIPAEYQPELGKATHIFVISNLHQSRSFLQSFREQGGFLVYNIVPNVNLLSKKLNVKREHHTQKIKRETSFCQTSYRSWIKLTKEVGSYPLSGTIAISEFLKYSLKELRTIGFTCYHLPNELHLRRKPNFYHKPEKDLLWLKAKADTDKRFVPGKQLSEIFRIFC